LQWFLLFAFTAHLLHRTACQSTGASWQILHHVAALLITSAFVSIALEPLPDEPRRVTGQTVADGSGSISDTPLTLKTVDGKDAARHDFSQDAKRGCVPQRLARHGAVCTTAPSLPWRTDSGRGGIAPAPRPHRQATLPDVFPGAALLPGEFSVSCRACHSANSRLPSALSK